MKDDADRVWKEAAEDARPRPRELLRAELELRRSYRASPKKLAVDVERTPTAKQPRLRAAHLLVAAAALAVTVTVSVWPEPDEERPKKSAIWTAPGPLPEQTREPLPETGPQPAPANIWVDALKVATDPQNTPQQRADACMVLDDSLFEIAKTTRDLLTDAVVASSLRNARQQWASALEGVATADSTDAEGDPAEHLRVLTDVTASSTDRERALALMHPLVLAGLAQLRAFEPFDAESRMMHPAMLRRLRETLR